jgi:hypothetical protein
MDVIAHEDAVPYIANMHWTRVGLTRSKYSLLTSDGPLVMPVGLDHPQLLYRVPPSIRRRPWRSVFKSAAIANHNKIAKTKNKEVVRQARQYVQGQDNSQLEFVSKRFARLPDSEIHVDGCRVHLIVCKAILVAWLQPIDVVWTNVGWEGCMANRHWVGTSGDWSNSTDWTGGKPPGAADAAIVDAPGTYTLTVTGTDAVGSVRLDDAGATLDITGTGTLAVSGSTVVQSGTLEIDPSGLLENGGTLTVRSSGSLLLNGTLQGGTLDLDHGSTLESTTTVPGVPGTLENVRVLGGLTLNSGFLNCREAPLLKTQTEQVPA